MGHGIGTKLGGQRLSVAARNSSHYPAKEGTFLRNVLIEGVDATGAIVSSFITGVLDLRPSDITVSNCRIRTQDNN